MERISKLATTSNDTITLHNGVKMPVIGFGTYKIPDGKQVEESVAFALSTGYRSIDTAVIYKNETGVGKAIKNSGLSREDIFLATKIWNADQGYESTFAAFEKSKELLNTDYIDLYLIHWPVGEKYVETWKAFEELYQRGAVKAIGVCNFKIHHLEELLKNCKVKPMINQVELHPYLNQKELRDFCFKNNIYVEAWSPLMRGSVLNDENIVMLSKKYNKTPAQIILRWHIQNDVLIIPKSVNPTRMKENINVFDFKISQDDMKIIDNLNKDLRIGPDPDNYELFSKQK
jgi:diketogulonate reductase-like aldo/keto reductase